MTTLAPSVFVSLCTASLPPPDRRCPSKGPEPWSGGRSSPPHHVEAVRSPKFLGEPQCEHAPLSDPGPVTHNRFSVASLLPSAPAYGVGFRATCRFRGSMTRPAHSLCTLRPRRSPLRTQHSLPAGHHPLLDRFRTCRVLSWKVSDHALATSSSSPFPRLSLAHKLCGRSRVPKPKRRAGCGD